jgi:hypothetical protein
MEGDQPGSELKEHQGNPYPDGSPEAEQFAEGQRAAVLTAQDAEMASFVALKASWPSPITGKCPIRV